MKHIAKAAARFTLCHAAYDTHIYARLAASYTFLRSQEFILLPHKDCSRPGPPVTLDLSMFIGVSEVAFLVVESAIKSSCTAGKWARGIRCLALRLLHEKIAPDSLMHHRAIVLAALNGSRLCRARADAGQECRTRVDSHREPR